MFFIYQTFVTFLLLFAPIVIILEFLKIKKTKQDLKKNLVFHKKREKWKVNLVSWGKCW